MELEDIPAALLVEILSRLGDSADLARCRLASRTLRSLSYDVQSLRLFCSRDRFLRLRAPAPRDAGLPAFKTLVGNLASLIYASPGPLSLSIAAERPHGPPPTDEVDDGDDLLLTEVAFLSRWLPLLSARLRYLSIDDCWPQSCWRPSRALSLISQLCFNLLNLEIKNASLSVEELKPMQNLTSLTLNFIRLDDANLQILNECFPSLQFLDLTKVGGLKEPKIHLLQLRFFTWEVSNFVLSLTVYAPKLVELNLKCAEPKSLHLETPLLTKLDVTIRKTDIKVHKFHSLKFLRMNSCFLRSLAQVFAENGTIKQLEIEWSESSCNTSFIPQLHEIDLSTIFPEVEELVLGPGSWFILPGLLRLSGEMRSLKKLVVHVPSSGIDATTISQKLSPLLAHSRLCRVMIIIPATGCADGGANFIFESLRKYQGIVWTLDTRKC